MIPAHTGSSPKTTCHHLSRIGRSHWKPPLWGQETTRNPRRRLRKAPSFAGIANRRHLRVDLAPVNRRGDGVK
uniref:Uncharacterized protein n=1 Tax=Setaria italica TaxID=4555 RepID=K3ZGK4_SETIT